MKARFIVLLQAISLVLLASCQQPSDVPVASSPKFLGTATLTFGASETESAIESQALVNGIRFEVLGRSVIDANGERYMTLTLEVINGSNQDLDNLSLFALARDYTVAGTALTNVRDAAGNSITNPEVVRSVRPSHTVTLRNGQVEIVASEADFQGYLPAEVAQVQVDADAVADDITVLNYGYAVRNTNGNKIIPAGARGIVNFTVRFPFDPDSPLGSPFRFSMPVAFVDMLQTRFTRGLDESNQDFTARVQSYYAPNAVPQDTELLLIGEPSTPLTIGTTLTVDDLRLFAEAVKPDLATFEDELGMVVRVDRANRQLAATFVDDDNRGSRLRVVPQANTQYFVEDEAVAEDTFWQQLKDVSRFTSDTVIVSGQQINDIVVVADRLTLTEAYDYRSLAGSYLFVDVLGASVNSVTDVKVNLELCTNIDSPRIYELSAVEEVRLGSDFTIDITIRAPQGGLGFNEAVPIPTFPPPSCITPSVFAIPLDLDEPLASGDYSVIINDINNNQPVSFAVP